MTISGPEIQIEGSHDGETWEACAFRYKPGDVARRPRWAEPHQPRLDWQMRFAALRDARLNPWAFRLMQGLLTGAAPVTRLLEHDPFEGESVFNPFVASLGSLPFQGEKPARWSNGRSSDAADA
jgi:hypothetical protein